MSASTIATLAAFLFGFFGLILLIIIAGVAMHVDDEAMLFHDVAHETPGPLARDWLPQDGGFLNPRCPRLHELAEAGQRVAPTMYPGVRQPVPRWNTISGELRAMIDTELGVAAST